MTNELDRDKSILQIDLLENRVDLIASGYEFICPSCNGFNTEMGIKEIVTCEFCNKSYETREIHHAFD